MKKYFLKSLIILLTVSFLNSCTSQKKILDSWLGMNKKDLILSWGPPTKTIPDGESGEILVYATQRYLPGENGQGGLVFWDYRYIYSDNTGKIYNWVTRRERVPPTQIDMNIYKRN
jgi:hypothetical protein